VNGAQGQQRWMKTALRLAGLAYLAGGVWLLYSPGPPPLCPMAGLMAALFGIGCWIASRAPLRHWPIALLGILGQTAMTAAARSGSPDAWPILAADLWVIPFALVLRASWKEHVGRQRVTSPEIQRMALRARTQYGVSLEELSKLSPLLLVFLRHNGCMFCREALDDLRRNRPAIEALGVRIALVHMGTDAEAQSLLAHYSLDDLPRVSDPERYLYRAFGLGRGGLLKLAGPTVWWRGFQAAILEGHGFGRIVGDAFQMPGVFLIFHGEVLRSYRHQSAADRPDYVRLATVEG